MTTVRILTKPNNSFAVKDIIYVFHCEGVVARKGVWEYFLLEESLTQQELPYHQVILPDLSILTLKC